MAFLIPILAPLLPAFLSAAASSAGSVAGAELMKALLPKPSNPEIVSAKQAEANKALADALNAIKKTHPVSRLAMARG